jgi:glycine C-acetyltransferase
VAVDRIGRPLSGVNFASQDYLNLASHPAVIEAAQTAAAQYGVVSLMVV